MGRLSTLTTDKEVVDLARVYCLLNGEKVKDYIADLIRKDLKETTIYKHMKKS